MTNPLYPEVEVQLSGEDGNAFVIASRVSLSLKSAGYGVAANEFFKEALEGDYDHLLQTVLKYITVT